MACRFCFLILTALWDNKIKFEHMEIFIIIHSADYILIQTHLRNQTFNKNKNKNILSNRTRDYIFFFFAVVQFLQ